MELPPFFLPKNPLKIDFYFDKFYTALIVKVLINFIVCSELISILQISVYTLSRRDDGANSEISLIISNIILVSD